LLSSCDVETSTKQSAFLVRKQRTLKVVSELSGVGLFSGLPINMRFIPAPASSGIVIRRIDLKTELSVLAEVHNVTGTPRCTNLGHGKVIIQSVEHILSALSAYNIDNLIVEVDGPEIPAIDGSALPFIDMIEKAGVDEQSETTHTRKLESVLHWEKGEVQLIALPADELKLSYTLSYPNHPILDAQFYTMTLYEKKYKKEIAPCRTFSLNEEIVPLLDHGMIKGGSFDSGVVIKGEQVMNPEGLRFPNEMVKHKILDLIGDLSLIGFPLAAHIIAIRSGHYSNVQFAKLIVNHFKQKES